MQTPIHRSVRLAALESFARSEGLKTRKERPLLVVCGDFAHFEKSVLGKVAAAGYFDAADAADWDSDGHSGRAVSAICWPGPGNSDDANTVASPRGRFRTKINDVPFDNRKDIVQKALKKVAGYTSAVDPRKHSGIGVVKSIANAAHDGVATEFPIPAEQYSADKSYEILIDNICGEIGEQSYIVDIRLPVVGTQIPLCYLKFRKERNRFQNGNEFVVLAMPTDVLSAEQLEICRQTVQQLKLDYAEIDVLRSASTGRIYVVDVNDTPYGPPNGLPDEDAKIAIKLLGSTIADHWWK